MDISDYTLIFNIAAMPFAERNQFYELNRGYAVKYVMAYFGDQSKNWLYQFFGETKPTFENTDSPFIIWLNHEDWYQFYLIKDKPPEVVFEYFINQTINT